MKSLSAKNLNQLINSYIGLLSAVAAIEGVEMPHVALDLDPRSTPLAGKVGVVAGPISRNIAWRVSTDPIQGEARVTWSTPNPPAAYEILHRRF